jgi:hypothetical protein
VAVHVLIVEDDVKKAAVLRRGLEIVDERRRAGSTILIATHDEGILDDAYRCIVRGAGEVLFGGKPGKARALPVLCAGTRAMAASTHTERDGGSAGPT